MLASWSLEYLTNMQRMPWLSNLALICLLCTQTIPILPKTLIFGVKRSAFPKNFLNKLDSLAFLTIILTWAAHLSHSLQQSPSVILTKFNFECTLPYRVANFCSTQLFCYFSDGPEKYKPYQLHTFAQVYHALRWEVEELSFKTKLRGAGKRQKGSNRAVAI